MAPPAALQRPRRHLLGGVSAALAEHLGAPVAVIRIAFAATALLGGAGVLLYAWLWALVPLVAGPEPVRRRAPVAGLLLIVGALLLPVSVATARSVPMATLLVGLLLVSAMLVSLVERDRVQHRWALIGWAMAVLPQALLVLGYGLPLLDLAVRFEWPPALLLGIAGILAGIVGWVVPPVVAALRRRFAEQAERVRRQQRAEIAAHLHDSVLQTLALIQNRAGRSSEVGRIARAQERELRDWLFEVPAAARGGLAEELRAVAEELELGHPVRFEVVAVGDGLDQAWPELFAAAREAMVNAARHAGGEVSVYLEGGPESVEVFVRDRGPGFAITAVPRSRIGVRESIIGRMRRAGGSAVVRAAREGEGTEVVLGQPRAGQAPAGAAGARTAEAAAPGKS